MVTSISPTLIIQALDRAIIDTAQFKAIIPLSAFRPYTLQEIRDTMKQMQDTITMCHNHLDGCSHGYSDELWTLTEQLSEYGT